MEFLSGGFYKATIHRVVQPPADQRGYTRLGLFYFAMPDDDLKLSPHVESPVFRERAVKRRFDEENTPTMEMWRKGRISAYGQSQLQKKANGDEQQVIHGIVVTHFN